MELTTSQDGTAIAFERVGTGPPLILIGGALNQGATAAPVAALLAPTFTVFTFDRRGRGASGDTPPYSPAREVEDLAALVAAAGGAAFVFGHSSGAGLALDATRAGVAITRLGVYEAPFIVDGTRAPVPADFATRLDSLVRSGRRGDAVTLFLTEAVGIPAEGITQMQSTPFWPECEKLAHTLVYDVTIMSDHMLGQPLPAQWADVVTLPTLVMDGEKSPAWQRNSMQALAALLPNARHHSFPDADHGVAPDAIVPVLTDFFTSTG
jgi:pimeloyl-ACP methyl ester carboxylesterase